MYKSGSKIAGSDYHGFLYKTRTLEAGCSCGQNDAEALSLEEPLREDGIDFCSEELAQATVPFQKLSQGTFFSPEDALQKGTIFSALYKPYEPIHCSRK